MAKKFYITTAIDYPSSKPHMGHCYEKVTSDVIARYKRLQGFDVFFSTGLDNHGKKIQNAAEKAGKPPKEFVKEMGKFFVELCKKYNISYTGFISTTDERHEDVVRKLFQTVYDKGEIYKGKYTGLYCVDCETFYTEKELKDGNCPVHNKPPKRLDEDSYFFKMSKYKEALLKQFRENPNYLLPESRRNEILSKLKDPLRDLSVSRQSVDWGVRLPNDPNHTMFVWVDALINYLSVIDYPGKKYERYWPADLHVIGKDIIFHHTVIWGSWLSAAGIPLPKSVFAHGFINIKGAKMSKSAGTVIDPLELAEKYNVDSVRYYLCREIPFGEDGDFSEEGIVTRHNNELADSLGNLLNRTVVLIGKKFNGEIPKGKFDENLKKQLNLDKIKPHMDKYELHLALNEIFSFVSACNSYVNEKEPWKLHGEQLANVLYTLADSLRVISILLSPFIPASCEKINSQLGVEAGKFDGCKFGLLKAGTKVRKEKVLFKKFG